MVSSPALAQPPTVADLNGELRRDLARHPTIVILDFGSQYAELIARRIRETEVFSVVLGHGISATELGQLQPRGLILSGGPNSTYGEGAPQCDPGLWDLDIPVLGVCYGMQLMVQQLGGQVEPSRRREYGRAQLWVDDPTGLLTNVDHGSTMWMSHGDGVSRLPEGFTRLAHTDNTPLAAIADSQRRLYGVQFHPEVVHSTCGMELLRNFVFHVCGCSPNWNTEAFVEEAIADVRAMVGERRVLLALSVGWIHPLWPFCCTRPLAHNSPVCSSIRVLCARERRSS